MDIILLERVEKLGAIGDVVTVKDGYARNFLLPNKKKRSVQTKPTVRFSKPTARKLKAITQAAVMKRKKLRAVLKASRSS